MKTRVTISELEYNATSTRAMVSDIHRTMVKNDERGDGKNSSVSDTWTVSTAE
jgi:hypothetical protein